jgi:PAS domain S-box-containing protein
MAFRFPDTGRILMAVWPAAGVGLASLLLNPRRLWPAIVAVLFASGNLADLIAGRPFFASLGFTTANILESLGCAWLVLRMCGEKTTFTRVREVLALVATAVFINAVTALVGAGTARLVSAAPFWAFWETWWISDGLGILLVTPAIIAWMHRPPPLKRARLGLVVEAGAFLVLWTMTTWLAFNKTELVGPHIVQPYLLVALLAWPALRFGQRGTTFALVLFAAIIVTSTAVRTGPLLWGGEGPTHRLLFAQFFVWVVTVAGLLLAASRAEARAAERAARDEQSRVRALGDNLPDSMVYQVVRELDGTMRFLYASAGVERLFGISAKSLLADARALYGLMVEEDRPSVVAARDASAEGMCKSEVEARFRRPEGEPRWTRLSSSPRRLADGRILWDGILTDITERKRAEAENAKLQEQLAHAQKMESIGRLAGGIAHDFNNMLGVILGYVEMALEDIDPVQPLHNVLREVEKAATRSAELTRQLLAFARKQTIAPKVLDVNEIVAGLLTMLKRLVGENVELAWRPYPNLWPVKIDPSQINQILANLCVNARDAIADVGTIAIATANATIDAEVSATHPGAVPGDFVQLTVRDSGCGMDKETLARVFEPYFTTKGIGRGTGLGLATVYGTVRQSNGFIHVDGELGKGTTFSIYFPRYLGKADHVRPEGVPTVATLGKATILIVEDEASLLKLAATVLERLGHTVLTASTPNQAIRLAETQRGQLQLLITDVVMPEMNGRDLAKRILSLCPGLKSLFMSGYTDDLIAHHGALDEGVEFIEKPFSAHDLAAKVHDVLGGE